MSHLARLIDHLSTILARLIVAPLFWGVREVGDAIVDMGGDEC